MIIAFARPGRLDDFAAAAFPFGPYVDFDYQLVGRIDRFDADQAGRVVLLVQWGVTYQDDEFIIAPRRDRFESRASRPGDYGSIAAAMSDVLVKFSRAVATELESNKRPLE